MGRINGYSILALIIFFVFLLLLVGIVYKVTSGSKKPAFDFSFSLESLSNSVVQGKSLSVTIKTVLVSGNTQSVYFDCSGLPPGYSCSFKPKRCEPDCNSIVKISISTTTPAGIYTFNIVGKGGERTYSANYKLTVFPAVSLPPAPFNFSLFLSPVSGSIVRGSRASTTIKTEIVSGAGEPVKFNCSGLPAGLLCLFEPVKCDVGCSSVLTIFSSSTIPQGDYRIVVVGTGGEKIQNSDYKLTVSSVSVPEPLVFDFQISLNPAYDSVVQGISTTATIKTGLLSGTSGVVSFSCSGLPSGSFCSVKPDKCKPPCNSTLTISSSVTTAKGTYTITVLGRGGGKTHSAKYGLTIQPISKEPPAPACPPAPLSYPTDKWDRVWCNKAFTEKLADVPDEPQTRFDNIWGDAMIAGIRRKDIGFRSGRTINFGKAGNYEFIIGSNGGLRVWIDGNLVLDRWKDRLYRRDRFTKYLTAGNHKFRLDYFEGQGMNRVSFRYLAK